MEWKLVVLYFASLLSGLVYGQEESVETNNKLFACHLLLECSFFKSKAWCLNKDKEESCCMNPFRDFILPCFKKINLSEANELVNKEIDCIDRRIHFVEVIEIEQTLSDYEKVLFETYKNTKSKHTEDQVMLEKEKEMKLLEREHSLSEREIALHKKEIALAKSENRQKQKEVDLLKKDSELKRKEIELLKQKLEIYKLLENSNNKNSNKPDL